MADPWATPETGRPGHGPAVGTPPQDPTPPTVPTLPQPHATPYAQPQAPAPYTPTRPQAPASYAPPQPQAPAPPAAQPQAPYQPTHPQAPVAPPGAAFRRGVAQVGAQRPRPAGARPSSPSWPAGGPSWPGGEPTWTEPGWPDQAGGQPAGGAGERSATRSWTDNRDGPAPRAPMRYQVRQLRKGGEWTSIGVLFAFVCWGIWAVSGRGADLAGPVLAFLLVLVIAAGVFSLSRLLGRVVLERSLHRVRRSAWGAHLVTGLFLAAAGIAYLGQTGWVVDAWTWLKGFFW